ncbi:MAG: PqqD family protein [Acidimicrobiia bacterium]
MTAEPDEVRWVRRADALWRVTPTALVVLPTDSVDPIIVGGAAPRVWALLADALPIDAIITLLADTWGDDPQFAEPDVVAVLERLALIGAVERTTSAST